MKTRLMNRSERLKEIESLLFHKVGGLRAVEIAEVCGVDRRTVYRDLSLMNKAGIPVYQKEGRFFLDRQHYAASVSLNLHELAALCHVTSHAAAYMEQQNPHTVSALVKLSRALPRSIAAHVQYVLELLQRHPVDQALTSILETLTLAWAEQAQVKLWYRSSADTVVIREFATYFIEARLGGALYVVGLDYASQKVITLRLQQIKRVQMLNMHYHIPSQLKHSRSTVVLDDAPREKPGEVVLVFSAEVVPLIRQRMNKLAQRITMLQDGRGMLNLRVSDWREIVPWVRSWGIDVEVLRPTVLRDHMAAEAARIAAAYARK